MSLQQQQSNGESVGQLQRRLTAVMDGLATTIRSDHPRVMVTADARESVDAGLLNVQFGDSTSRRHVDAVMGVIRDHPRVHIHTVVFEQRRIIVHHNERSELVERQ